MGSVTPYQRLLEFQQLTESQDVRAEAPRKSNIFQQVCGAAVHHWKLIIGLILLGGFFGLALAWMQKPVYRAKALVEIQAENTDLHTQVRLFDSDGVLWTAAVKSGLLDLPEYAGLSRAAGLERIHRNLKVSLAEQTRIVEVAFESNDASLAAGFTNEVVQAYRSLIQGRNLASARQMLAPLEAQLAERKERAEAAQSRLQEYVKTHRMSSIEYEESRLRNLQAALLRAEQESLNPTAAGNADAARRRERTLRAQYAQLISRPFQALQLDLDQRRADYQESLRKFQDASSSVSNFADGTLVLDAARLPELPFRPNKNLAAAFGMLCGLMAGLIVALNREARAIQLASQAQASAALGVPQLGVAPPAWVDAPTNEPKRLTPAESRERYALWNFHNPGSAHAEAYRDIATSLIFSSERSHDRHLRVVVTSANSGEGRTTAAVNLATGIAETGCRVLLIDGNRGKQALHEIFDAPDTTGFFQAVAIQDGLTAPVFASDVTNLFVMPAGPYNNALLDVTSLRKVLDDVRETYDVIIIDAPPVLGHADARWFARVCDGVVLVHDPRISTAQDAQAALARLQSDRIHIFGTLLNQWPDFAHPGSLIPKLLTQLKTTR